MFAVIKTGGKQYRVQEGDVLQVEKLDVKKGHKVTFNEILLIEDKGKTLIGTPFVENALVKAEIIENFKGKKITVFKKKRRKQYKKKRGHRQEFTRVKIEEILPSLKAAPKKKPVEVRLSEEIEYLERQALKRKAGAKEAKKEEPKRQEEKKEGKEKLRVQGKAKALKSKKSIDKTSSSKQKAAAKAVKPTPIKEKENGS